MKGEQEGRACYELGRSKPACAEITLLDMYELMDGGSWLEKDDEGRAEAEEYRRWQELALRLKDRLASRRHHHGEQGGSS
ncbi:DUF4274 domain-containing protein [Paenibacillus thiaminolyticus]|nr:DUF4274 domain-containing protein [Paenibacillus thiaminolyticus]